MKRREFISLLGGAVARGRSRRARSRRQGSSKTSFVELVPSWVPPQTTLW